MPSSTKFTPPSGQVDYAAIAETTHLLLEEARQPGNALSAVARKSELSPLFEHAGTFSNRRRPDSAIGNKTASDVELGSDVAQNAEPRVKRSGASPDCAAESECSH